MNMWCTARLKFDARQVAKNAIYTAFICNFCFRFTHTFLLQKLFMHFFVTKRICAHFFCRGHGLHVFLRKRFTHFIWKVFARWKLPSGKFRLFGPLPLGEVTVLWNFSIIFFLPNNCFSYIPVYLVTLLLHPFTSILHPGCGAACNASNSCTCYFQFCLSSTK